MRDERAEWIARLRAVAAHTLGEHPAPPDPATFCDEAGHTRAVDAPFIAWCAAAASTAPIHTPAIDEARAPLDVRLWRALHDPTQRTDEVARRWPCAHGVPQPLTALMTPAEFGLEVATEMQLCALHALTWLARRAHAAPARETLRAAARSTIADLADTVQPDNATNHPWAIHAFVLEALAQAPVRPAADLLLYAQTLLHNCRVQRSRPDRLSAWILWDGARALEAHDPDCTGAP